MHLRVKYTVEPYKSYNRIDTVTITICHCSHQHCAYVMRSTKMTYDIEYHES